MVDNITGRSCANQAGIVITSSVVQITSRVSGLRIQACPGIGIYRIQGIASNRITGTIGTLYQVSGCAGYFIVKYLVGGIAYNQWED